jgi:hypothetical protein
MATIREVEKAKRKKDTEPDWRAGVIESCKKGGLRKNCDSEEEIQKRRPASPEARERRKQRHVQRQKNQMQELQQRHRTHGF